MPDNIDLLVFIKMLTWKCESQRSRLDTAELAVLQYPSRYRYEQTVNTQRLRFILFRLRYRIKSIIFVMKCSISFIRYQWIYVNLNSAGYRNCLYIQIVSNICYDRYQESYEMADS